MSVPRLCFLFHEARSLRCLNRNAVPSMLTFPPSLFSPLLSPHQIRVSQLWSSSGDILIRFNEGVQIWIMKQKANKKEASWLMVNYCITLSSSSSTPRPFALGLSDARTRVRESRFKIFANFPDKAPLCLGQHCPWHKEDTFRSGIMQPPFMWHKHSQGAKLEMDVNWMTN